MPSAAVPFLEASSSLLEVEVDRSDVAAAQIVSLPGSSTGQPAKISLAVKVGARLIEIFPVGAKCGQILCGIDS